MAIDMRRGCQAIVKWRRHVLELGFCSGIARGYAIRRAWSVVIVHVLGQSIVDRPGATLRSMASAGALARSAPSLEVAVLPMRLLREPLLYFAVAGAILFAGHEWLNRDQTETAAGEPVRIGAGEVRWLEETFANQWMRHPRAPN